MTKKKYAPLTPWEIAKPLLEADVIARRIHDSMKPMQVKVMRDEYKACGKTFGSNLRRMQKSIRESRSTAFLNATAYKHDIEIYGLARDDEKCWDGSACQRRKLGIW